MTRQRRIYFKNIVYHITIRGNNKQGILEEESDKKSFLDSLNKFKCRFEFKLYGFVLMDNHAHLVIEANGKANISKIMQAIALSYSAKFRKKYPYTGHVWQGRFRSNIIGDDRYILECLNYIHNNPVRAEMVGKAREYFWSSYYFYAEGQNKIKNYILVDKFTG
jgi:REP element-mobilizing transposase RayT